MNALLDTLLSELIHRKLVKNKTDFSDKINVGKSYLSRLVSGALPLSDKIATKIATEFPMVNKTWLLTGAGDMFTGLQTQPATPQTTDLNSYTISIDRPTQITININPMAASEEPTQVRGNIIKKLKQARNLSGYDLEKMAYESGIPPEDIECIEAGKSTKAQLWEYIQYLHKEGFDINSLFDDTIDDVRIVDKSGQNVDSPQKVIYKKTK